MRPDFLQLDVYSQVVFRYFNDVNQQGEILKRFLFFILKTFIISIS